MSPSSAMKKLDQAAGWDAVAFRKFGEVNLGEEEQRIAATIGGPRVGRTDKSRSAHPGTCEVGIGVMPGCEVKGRGPAGSPFEQWEERRKFRGEVYG